MTCGVSGSVIGRVLVMTQALLPRRRRTAATPQQSERVVVPDTDLPVLTFPALIERTRTASLVELVRVKLGFPIEVFERAVRPVIENYADFVQLLPAPVSRYHAHPGGLFAHALEIVLLALDYRRGQILPRGAAPEVIGEQAHRWTYAVFVVALLNDVGRNVAGLRVLVRRGRGEPEPWTPLAGSMRACGAVSYRVESWESAALYDALYTQLPVLLLNRFLPAPVLAWLAADRELMRELLAVLSGDPSARNGAVSGLVLRAATESMSPKRRAGLCSTDRKVTPAAAQPATVTQTTDESALPVEEPVYLEDLGHERQGPLPPMTLDSRPDDKRPADSAFSPSQPSAPVDAITAQASHAVHRFIAWLREGISDGTIRVNEAGALVHGVDEGMLLVSPRIFKEFAKRFGEDGTGHVPTIAVDEADSGKWIQRRLLRAGWHVRVDKGVNIVTYQVIRKGRAVSRLSGVVITNPARFVNPVPPVNSVLARLLPRPGDA